MQNYSFHNTASALCYLILIGFILSSSPALANKRLRQLQSLPQQIQISGTITDGTSPLPGVTISIKGKATTATISDFNGQYTITALPEDTLVFNFMGFKTVLEPVNGRKTINIQLQEDITSLQEVRVNAGYYSVKEKERTGSIAHIKAKDIETQPVTNVLAAMQGRMAGVNITQTSGVPGGGFDIQIRGRNSIRTDGNTPLYIVNGMPYASDNLGNTAISGTILPGAGISPLNTINPSDIESIEILKDADATAIYGSRGANGVVLITTKKGKAGKTRFAINSYTGTGKVTRTLDLLNTQQYIEVREEAYANDGISVYPTYANDINGTWDRTRYTDWQQELIGGTALTRSMDASVSGGSSSTQFLLRGTNYNETTVFPGDFAYGKSAVLLNVNHQSDDKKFQMGVSANYVADKNNLLGTDLTRDASILAPNAPALYKENGELNWENGTFTNPLRLLESKYLAKTKGLVVSSDLSYIILPDLVLKTQLGYSDTRVQESRTTPSTLYNPALGLTSSVSAFLKNQSSQNSWSIEPQLTWKKELGKSTLRFLAGTTFQERTTDQLALQATGFSSNSLITNVAAAATKQVLSNNVSMYRYNALSGRINYDYDGTYFINFTGRRDGSSRFGAGNRFATFGAVGIAWLFHKLPFIERALPVLSFAKLRSSYGTTGSDQIGDYQFLNTYSPATESYQGVVGLQPTRLFNPDFSWETNKKIEGALELGFMKDRIFITVAHYSNRSSNQLVGIPLPRTTGFASIQSNLNATVANRGWELELRTVNFQNQNFKWTTSWNVTFAKNELLSFPDLDGSVYANQYVLGESLNIRKVYENTGINPLTGVYQFTDFNGDGLITAGADRKKIVDASPEYFGGVHNSLTYKNLELDFLFQFVKQLGINFNATGVLPGTANNIPVANLDRWQEPGDAATVQLYTTGFNAAATAAFSNNYVQSDAAYTDASYLRLKNLSLGYTLPKKWFPSINCKLYVQGQNLLTITNFAGADPENQTQGKLPPLRILTLGVQVKF
jgi:TonB-linked SusC/RagA family outer membrane protein